MTLRSRNIARFYIEDSYLKCLCRTWTQLRNSTTKAFLIVGNLGLVNAWSLKPLADCPANALFLDSYYAANDGTPVKISNTFCIFENHAGSIIWRHTEFSIPGEVVSDIIVVCCCCYYYCHIV
jgi:Cu2+-containing amine oxidase